MAVYTAARISGFDHPPADGSLHALRNLYRVDQKVIAFSFSSFFLFFFLATDGVIATSDLQRPLLGRI